MRNILLAGCALAVAVFSAPVQAAGLDGAGISDLQIYAHLTAGVALPGTIRIDGGAGSNGSPTFTGTMTFDAGPSFGVALGAYMTPNIRTEVGIYAATNTAKSYDFTFTGFGNVKGKATGSVQTVGLAVTGFYDFTQFGDFVPYLDAGFGVTNVSTSNLVADVSPTGVTSGNSTVPAVRLGGGFNYKISENLTLGADYFAVIGLARTNFTYNDPANANVRTINTDVIGHSASVSLHLSF